MRPSRLQRASEVPWRRCFCRAIAKQAGRPFSLTAGTAVLLACLASAAFAAQPATPVFAPADGSTVPVDVTITAETDVTIHYTADGSLPDESSPVFTTPIPVASPGVLRARAYRNGDDPSFVANARYFEAAPPVPEFTVDRTVSGAGSAAPSVSLAITAPPGVRCWTYEELLPPAVSPDAITVGGVWLPGPHAIRWGPFLDTASATLVYTLTGFSGTYSVSGSASLDGYWTIPAAATTVTIGQPPGGQPTEVSPPLIATNPSPFVRLPVSVTLSTPTDGAEIRFTTDGSTPSAASTPYTDPLEITVSTCLQARAFKTGFLPSPVRSAWFTNPDEVPPMSADTVVDTTAPAAPVVTSTVAPGPTAACWTYQEQLPLSLTPAGITNAGVFNPATGILKWGPFNSPDQRVFAYTLTGQAGSYSVGRAWSIDGRGASQWPGFQVVIASDGGTITPPPLAKVAAPVLDPPNGNSLPLDVSISCASDGATIRYTTDGSIPTAASTVYQGPLHLTTPTILIAKAFLTGQRPSAHVMGVFGTPEEGTKGLTLVRTVSGDASVAPIVTVTATPAGAVSCYSITEDVPQGLSAYEVSAGGHWNETTHLIHWGPFNGTTPQTVSYRVSDLSGTFRLDGSGSFDGQAASTTGASKATVLLDSIGKVALPVISPTPTGLFPSTVSISCPTPGAVIHFTTDGTLPNAASPVYQTPITLLTVTLVQAKAFVDWMRASDIAQRYYGPEMLPPDATLTRRVIRSGTVSPQVDLIAHPGGQVGCYSVQETIPAGAVPHSITAGGLFNALTRTIKWGPFLGSSDRTLSYHLGGTGGLYTLSGSGSFNGFHLETGGEQEVLVGNFAATSWQVTANHTLTPSTRLDVAPASTVTCYSVEAFLPDGLTPTEITDGGLWNAETAVIKWGPFRDATARECAYTIGGSYLAYEAGYRISVDGLSMIVYGDVQVEVSLPAPQNLTATSGNATLFLAWSPVPAATGYRLYYRRADGVDGEQSIDLGLPGTSFYSLRGLVNGQLYNCQITAYGPGSTESARSATVSATPNAGTGDWGGLAFDKGHYDTVTDLAVLNLTDADLNTNPATADTVLIQVASTTDPAGIQLMLTETGPDTGVFTSSASGLDLGFTFDASDEAGARLRVREGDTLTASYGDILPAGIRTATATFSEYDSDHDGLPDWWERENFGSLTVANATSDFDHDGSSDLQEWITGTSPTAQASRQQVSVEVRPGEGVIVRWTSVPGRRYTLRKSIGSLNAFFDLIADLPANPGGVNEYRDILQPDASSVFYSIRVELDP